MSIKIELIDKMGEDLTVSNVARVSFNKWKEELDEKDVSLIHYLARESHTSPFRHTCIQLRCEAPVFLARQLVKHTVGLTWNEVSRRYVDVDIGFYTPDSWRSRPTDGIKQGSGEVIEANDWAMDAYQTALETALHTYEYLLSINVAPEMARMVLPQSMLVSWIWTGSLQAFHHVYSLRSGKGAQKEAQEFAAKLEEVIIPIFPHSWKALTNAKTH